MLFSTLFIVDLKSSPSSYRSTYPDDVIATGTFFLSIFKGTFFLNETPNIYIF